MLSDPFSGEVECPTHIHPKYVPSEFITFFHNLVGQERGTIVKRILDYSKMRFGRNLPVNVSPRVNSLVYLSRGTSFLLAQPMSVDQAVLSYGRADARV